MSDAPAAVDRRVRRERLAKLRARRERMGEAIARGWSDIVYEPPLTPAEREALGLDLGFFDDSGADRGEPAATELEVVIPRDYRR